MSVRFNPHVTLVSFAEVPVASHMTEEEKSSAWYSHDEITAFRNNVRETSRIIRRRNRDESTATRPQHELVSESEECSRGLEHRIYYERQTNKIVALRFVMECQRRLRAAPPEAADAEGYLANASARLSQWARAVALNTGQEDFVSAYPEMKPFVLSSISNFPQRKRKSVVPTQEQPEAASSSCCNTERRVRRRISAPTNTVVFVQ